MSIYPRQQGVCVSRGGFSTAQHHVLRQKGTKDSKAKPRFWVMGICVDQMYLARGKAFLKLNLKTGNAGVRNWQQCFAIEDHCTFQTGEDILTARKQSDETSHNILESEILAGSQRASHATWSQKAVSRVQYSPNLRQLHPVPSTPTTQRRKVSPGDFGPPPGRRTFPLVAKDRSRPMQEATLES